ncbi:MAG: M23 family metallopeptidase [Rhodospirillales bacterium]|nr:M23 family metallopeptidase [Rhodospirillales bacterium]
MRKAGSSIAVAGLVLGSAYAHAEPPTLSLPAACEIGTSCWLVNFVDHDPGPGATDYRCGGLSYDTHKGTDIAIRNDAAMSSGIDVLAAAPGKVAGTRDGMGNSTKADLESATALRGRDCGNGVRIEHEDGWSTQYCHMMKGSIRVRTGDVVERGQVIGMIGRSGRTEFPHIHLSLRQGERVIDPFTGESNITACDTAEYGMGSLWDPALKAALAYPGPQPFHLGFASKRPKTAEIESGALNRSTFPPDTGALVFFAEAFSLKKDDVVTLTLTAPDGSIVADHTVTLDRPLAKGHWFTGRKRRGTGWETGLYTGTITITRDGVAVAKSATARVE